MAGLFSTPNPPPVTPAPAAPSIADDSVQKAADEQAKQRLNRGRASTFLTNPQMQREDQPQTLGGR